MLTSAAVDHLNIISHLESNMVSRANKVGLNSKPLTVSQTTPGYGSSTNKFFLLCKQIWYVPFFWALTWFTYWILHATVVLGTPLTQLNPIDLIGAAISTSIFVTALVQQRFHANNRNTVTAYPKEENSAQKIQAKEPLTSQTNIQTALGNARENPESSQKLTPPQPVASATASGVKYSKQNPASQEILDECLTCENLINCHHRRSQHIEPQDQGSENTRCPFAQNARKYLTVQNNIAYLNRPSTTN
jgi:hypothetical protein